MENLNIPSNKHFSAEGRYSSFILYEKLLSSNAQVPLNSSEKLKHNLTRFAYRQLADQLAGAMHIEIIKMMYKWKNN